MEKISNINIKELVCNHIKDRYTEEQLYSFFDPRLLQVIDTIRNQILKKPMTINDGSTYTQRGIRCNMCQLVKSKIQPYMSAHIRGMAIDFHVNGMTAELVRQLIDLNKHLLPCNIRLERDVNWVHVDVCNTNGLKIQYFKG